MLISTVPDLLEDRVGSKLDAQSGKLKVRAVEELAGLLFAALRAALRCDYLRTELG
jgi:hypothetical protein